jgi:hypothetical protein
MNTCRKCGSREWQVLKETPVILARRCRSCGYEQTRLASPADEPELPANLEPLFTVMARWRRSPTPRELEQLRDGFPLLPDALLMKAQKREAFELGRFYESAIRAQAQLLERLDLELQWIPVPPRPVT